MKKLLISIIALVLLSAPTIIREEGEFNLYFPMLYSHQSYGIGFQVEIGSGASSGLADLQPTFIRHFLGTYLGDNAHQVYLSGGWTAVDNYVLEDILAIKQYSEPIISLTYGGICKVPTFAQLDAYADFLSAFAERYDITYLEVWNEPDSKGGISSLFGCFGDQYVSKLIYLVQQVKEKSLDRMIGVSFMMDDILDYQMFSATIPYLDWVGVHHYGVWSEGIVFEPYPGTIQDLYDLVTPQDIPVFLTETNLREPTTICSTQFREDQAEYNKNTLLSDFEVKIILVYAGGSNWQCTGIKNSLTHELLKYPLEFWP